jgi:hypothetical protein
MSVQSAGVELEARVQRLFLAQGIFAERGLLPSADDGHHMMATDIDVLTSEYASGFHLTRRHAECKSGKNVALLDRILWLRGVRSMLGADTSYLIVADFNEGASNFARSLEVDVLTVNQLESWETSIDIRLDLWPNRSNYALYQPVKNQWLKIGKQKEAGPHWQLIREAIQFVEIDSWLRFRYGLLSRLLRLFSHVSAEHKAGDKPIDWTVAAKYTCSALLVRLAQYLLAVCHDVTRVPVSDVNGYLYQRLTFGDQDPERAMGLIKNTIAWVEQGLRHTGTSLPSTIDIERLSTPPSYAGEFVSLIQRLLKHSNEARYLPIAVETAQFADIETLKAFPRLKAAASAGDTLAALTKGFVIAALPVEKPLVDSVREDLQRSTS